MPVGRGHVDGQRLRAVRHRTAESLGCRIEIQPGRQRRPIRQGRRVGQRPPFGSMKVSVASVKFTSHPRSIAFQSDWSRIGGAGAGVSTAKVSEAVSPLVLVADTMDAQVGGVVRNHAGKSQARSVELQPRRQRRPVGEIRSVGQRLALRIGEGVGRQRKIDRLSLLPRLGRRLRADDWALCHEINGEFPPISPIRAVEGADGDGVGSGRATGLQAQVREVGGI